MSYKHILFSTDLSPQSKKAAKKARFLADKYNATLDLVHVVEHSPVAYGGEFSIPIDINLEQQIEAAAKKALAQQGDAIKISPDRQHLILGSVKSEVLNLAKKLGVDLILVGTHSHHGLDALLGSRANAILHGAQCDVLAVRAD